jgi:hypothetical protein
MNNAPVSDRGRREGGGAALLNIAATVQVKVEPKPPGALPNGAFSIWMTLIFSNHSKIS